MREMKLGKVECRGGKWNGAEWKEVKLSGVVGNAVGKKKKKLNGVERSEV